MLRTRSTLVSLDDTSYYHCISRWVRRAFLWGEERHSGKDDSRRKQWVIDRPTFLADIFAIELRAHAAQCG
jgi:putative transposase